MRKNFIRTLVALLLIFALTGATAYAESATVIGNAVNLREGPGTGYRIAATLTAGTVVEVTDRSNANWYAVRYGEKSGYMAAGYLQLLGGSEQPAVVIGTSAGSEAPVEGSAVIVFDNAAPSFQITANASAAQPVTQEPQPITQQTATPPAATQTTTPAAAASVTLSPTTLTVEASVSAPVPDAEEGAAVIILGNNTIVLPSTSTGGAQSSQSTQSASSASTGTSRVGKTGYINGDFVCFRSGASTSASIITTYNKGKEVEITGAASGDWTPVKIDGKSGYVFSKYITLGEEYLASMSGGYAITANTAAANTGAPADTSYGITTLTQTVNTNAGTAANTTATASTSTGNAYITGNNVRFRSSPSMNAAIIGEFFYGNSVTVTGTSGDWTAVNYNGKSGYVYSQYVKSGSFSAGSASSGSTSYAISTAVATANTYTGGSVSGQQIVDYALQFVGYRYVWGGASPETGFDCSGFVQYVFKQFGYNLNRVACDQAKNGVHVDSSAIQPGDILCFYSSDNYIGHTAIYIGNNRFVHASTSTTGVIISELNGYYWTRGYEARRIV